VLEQLVCRRRPEVVAKRASADDSWFEDERGSIGLEACTATLANCNKYRGIFRTRVQHALRAAERVCILEAPVRGCYGTVKSVPFVMPDRRTEPGRPRRLLAHFHGFNNTYVQQAVCGPSRNSFMSGRRPSSTRTWNFKTSFRESGVDAHGVPGSSWSTLPQAFKEAG
jgi:hypothetical protein